jgi:hypothetical protein
MRVELVRIRQRLAGGLCTGGIGVDLGGRLRWQR